MHSFFKSCALLASALLVCSAYSTSCRAQTPNPKKKVTTETDLPRITYPAVADSVQLVKSDAEFKPFLARFSADLDNLLNNYDIEDKATLRKLLGYRESVEELQDDLKGFEITIEQERGLQEKPSAKANFRLNTDSLLQAWKEAGTLYSPTFLKAIEKSYGLALQSADWSLVQDELKGERTYCGLDFCR